ncbi:hypothetical protein RB653_008457 [Dictyostelium firmibasis]|uniref:Uncharacterized protein n=1 Tax=Dictyostelium firmibasis TaxID=79012 RepID=A0AAN7TSL4_9MYCE
MKTKVLLVTLLSLMVICFINLQVSADKMIKENTYNEYETETLDECLKKCQNRHYLKDPCIIRCHVLHPIGDDK